MPEGYTHLTPDDRCQIEVLLRRGDSNCAIGLLLGRPASTIRREIARNAGLRGYRKRQAQLSASARRSAASRRAKKMTPAVITGIEAKLIEAQWSPEQISGWMQTQAGAGEVGSKVRVSHERIYQHVWQDKRAGGELWRQLRHNGKKYNKRKGMTAGRGCIPNRIDISKRPAIVEDKARIGDWEIDTVIGAGHKGALVTAVDRMSKYVVIEAVANKTAEAVTAALVRTLTAISAKVLTLTADNGREFAEHQKIATALNADFYFARPYHSWERGLNEHTNGLLRQYFPKGQRLDGVTKTEVDRAAHLLNSRPRKILGYKTPQEVFSTPPPGALHC